ncbi:hypothetical protein [Nocardia brasiliensis]|uniref:Uncharacterized protein n=1 Tax=Nocardia brasiliensis (strain ATCC 700358 / HUJEG-1) TaxID=1133849 RepID=K0F0X7_NOCB7|nr:hypothetical protein [Nocardia brasiliensis]AFU01326.1 hypothetical protein O3I_016825 [Nocardia brasiliensis ATCC 700358]
MCALRDPGHAGRTTVWHNAIDRLMAFEVRMLESRVGFENASVVAVERVVRALGLGAEPAVTGPADHGSSSALEYFVSSQVQVIRDIAIAQHDYAKRLMIAARPLLTEELFAELWLGFRNSGRTPRVRVRRDNPTRVELSEPTERQVAHQYS